MLRILGKNDRIYTWGRRRLKGEYAISEFLKTVTFINEAKCKTYQQIRA